MSVRFRFLALLVLILVLALVAAIPSAAGSNVEYGPEIPMGNGSLQSFVALKGNGTPKVIGIEFDGAALTGLPDGAPSDGTWDILNPDGTVAWYCCGYEHILTLPASAAATPFEHIVVNWNNHGHVPPGIYDVPHFDFHFYMISNEERSAITAPASSLDMCPPPGPGLPPSPLTCENVARALAPLSPAQSPPDFFSPGAVEPGMGNHMLDMFAPELNGEPFTQTWIFGTWDGVITFFEPMITTDYLQGLEGNICYDLKMPAAFAEEGYYPTRYCTFYQRGQDTYRITLDKFEWFDSE